MEEIELQEKDIEIPINKCNDTENVELEFEKIKVVKQYNDIGTAGFVLSVICIIFFWVPIVNMVLWLLGFLFSLAGIHREPNKLAKAGIFISILGIVLTIIGVLIMASVFAPFFEGLNEGWHSI